MLRDEFSRAAASKRKTNTCLQLVLEGNPRVQTAILSAPPGSWPPAPRPWRCPPAKGAAISPSPVWVTPPGRITIRATRPSMCRPSRTSPSTAVLEFDVTKALVREIEAKTPYKVVSCRESADTELKGTILSLTKSLLNRNQLNEVREAQTLMRVSIIWRDLHTGEILSAQRKYGELLPPGVSPGHPARPAAGTAGIGARHDATRHHVSARACAAAERRRGDDGPPGAGGGPLYPRTTTSTTACRLCRPGSSRRYSPLWATSSPKSAAR